MSLPLVTMVWQRHEADCGAAVLAMYLGISYEDALLALGVEVPGVLRSGAWMTNVQRAAASLGVPLKVRRKWDHEDADGIAQMKLPGPFNHFVLIRGGLLFNTNGTVWEMDDYLKSRKATPGVLLVADHFSDALRDGRGRKA